MSAGYFNSDPFPRPTGRIPLIQDPRDPSAMVGGALYPEDGTGPTGTAFANRGTSQPKFDARVDQEIGGGRITYAGGIAGTQGIIHTGIGPFDIQKGSYMGYTKVNYQRGAMKVNFFANLVNAEAPNLLLPDPLTQKPLQLNFKTQTYDVERPRYSGPLAGTTSSPTAATSAATTSTSPLRRTPRTATSSARSCRTRSSSTACGSPSAAASTSSAISTAPSSRRGSRRSSSRSTDHAIRVSFNRAFRSPSVVNNYLDISIVVPTDLSALAPLPALRPFPLVVRAVGSRLPIGGQAQSDLKEESLTAYEVAYTGTLASRTMVGAAFYVNDLDDNINFTQLPNNLDPYTAANPPPGWPLPAAVLALLAQRGIFLPRTAFTYLNLGPIRNKGLELSTASSS